MGCDGPGGHGPDGGYGGTRSPTGSTVAASFLRFLEAAALASRAHSHVQNAESARWNRMPGRPCWKRNGAPQRAQCFMRG